ncbi:MAG TPA: hypothetical protein VMD27_11445 [Candidatus Aquilonibacter sp.]|nr:hypothetical protein [Candidatus Aquilonibacter sp.]
MSEFKYACPVCGQHIKCDSAQAGTVMECPTCFQKITVPQAPSSEEQKFILTGTKKGERPIPTISGTGSRTLPAAKGFPGALMVVLIFFMIGSAVAFIYRGTIFKSRNAGDDNWTLNLDGVTIPDVPATGRIHGENFTNDRAIFQNGALMLRAGTRGPVDLGVMIDVGDRQPEDLASESLDVATNSPTASRVTLRWQGGRENLESGYALRLEFGEISGNRISGKIYFCAPDQMKSYVAGTFNAEIRRPRPKRQN